MFLGDEDRSTFLGILASVVGDRGWLCHAYCLMDNHYHLIVETPMADLSAGMQRLNSVYAQTFNAFRGRAGHLFSARYHSVLVQKEGHLLEAARYVVLNPVRAGLCERAGDWAWSSYNATAGSERKPGFLTTDWLLGQLSPMRPEAEERYRRFVAEGAACETKLKPAGGVLGSDEYRRVVARQGRTWAGGEQAPGAMERWLVPARPESGRVRGSDPGV